MIKNIANQTTSNLPVLYFDGGSRGNPGKAAGAAVIVMPDGKQHTISQYIQMGTNNEAEYTGLIIGLQKAQELGIQKLTVKGDSQLVVNQINGQWKINSPNLKDLHDQAKILIKNFQNVTVNWIKRNENHLADAVANECMDKGQGKQQKSPPSSSSKQIPQGVSPYVTQLIKLGEKAKFEDYAKLKSGRDEYTLKQLSQLKKIVPEEIQKTIEKDWNGNDQYLAKVYRWYLRGLPPNMAIHKVKVDAEIVAKATGEHPWLEDKATLEKVDKLPKIFPYAQGDIITITDLLSPEMKHQGVIITPPEKHQADKWRLTIEIEVPS